MFSTKSKYLCRIRPTCLTVAAIRKNLPRLVSTTTTKFSFKPYRIIYRVSGRFVYVFLIADGRRDMQTLLQRRLLSSKP